MTLSLRFPAATAALLLALMSVDAGSATLPPLVYTLRFPAAQTHYVDVEMSVPTAGAPEIELMMAVWTPGSYLVREFARNVEDVRATGPAGAPLAVAKTTKNRWRVATGGAAAVTVTYRVYCREMSVRTNWVESRFALLNGGPTFLTLAGSAARPHEVRVELPAGWATTVSPLPAAPGGLPHRYLAADFDTLVDSPLLAGSPALYEFTEAGVPHVLVNMGEGGVWDGPRSARDVQQIVKTNAKLWGSLPYPRYVFFNMLTESGGGLEHKDSTVMMSSRWRTGTRKEYVGWLGLVSHEYFHAWNVKRLRPVELGPFDYEHEVYTTGLWIAEGFTSYYDGLNVRRTGLSTREEFLDELGGTIRDLQNTPGRLALSASQSSFDSWIKQYRPDENSPNTSISYYTKGGVVAFLLDAHVRALTNSAKSLDDVMRLAFARFSGAKGYTQAEFRRTASEVAGADLGEWFRRAVDSTEELSYDEALEWFGLRFRNGDSRGDKGWLGATTKADGGRLLVTQVRRGTPAFDAGINVDDEIIGIDDYRVRPEQLESRLEHYRPGQRVSVLVSRRDELLRLDVVLGAEPGRRWGLEVRPDATPAQQARLKAWMWE